MILFAIKEDCVGEPPGELMIRPTTGDFLSANNLSINFSKLFIAKPEPVKPDCDDITVSYTHLTLPTIYSV